MIIKRLFDILSTSAIKSADNKRNEVRLKIVTRISRGSWQDAVSIQREDRGDCGESCGRIREVGLLGWH